MRTVPVLGVIATILGVMIIAVAVRWLLTTPTEGTIEAAWLEPAHSETYQSGSICTYRNDDGYCTISVPIYSTRWVPDRCWVQIRDTERTDREATWRVGCRELDELEPGKWWRKP